MTVRTSPDGPPDVLGFSGGNASVDDSLDAVPILCRPDGPCTPIVVLRADNPIKPPVFSQEAPEPGAAITSARLSG